MPKDFLKLNIKYELKDNGDTTQNLFVKTYQNSSLISERDFGNICEIVKERKFRENLIKYLEDKMNEIRIGGCDCLTTKMVETEKRVYREVLERLKSGKYE